MSVAALVYDFLRQSGPPLAVAARRSGATDLIGMVTRR